MGMVALFLAAPSAIQGFRFGQVSCTRLSFIRGQTLLAASCLSYLGWSATGMRLIVRVTDMFQGVWAGLQVVQHVIYASMTCFNTQLSG